MSRVGVILNPHAYEARRTRDLPRRLERLLGGGGKLVVTADRSELARAADQFERAGVDLVAVAGGDGTLSYTVDELTRAYGRERLPRIAPLRGGTVNTIARNFAIVGAPEALLRGLLAADGAGHLKVTRRTLLSVNGQIGFLFASLMGARFLELYYNEAKGSRQALGLALRTAASCLVAGRLARRLFAPLPIGYAIDGGGEKRAPFRLVVASSVPDVGLGMRVAWRAGARPGTFHLLATGLAPTALALQLPRVLAGAPLFGAPHVDLLARSTRLAFPRPSPHTLDGELFSAETVEVGCGPAVEIAQARAS